MKIALLMSAAVRPTLFTAKAMDRLRSFGTVCFNETAATDAETIKAVIKDADIAITSWGNTTLTEDILDCAPNLKLVAHAAGSVKPIVSDALFARGIPVISSAIILSRGVSETALGFTIAATKNFFNLNAQVHNGGWAYDRTQIKDLFEITIGVIGCGYAGAHYIELLQPFDVHVLAYDPYVDEAKIRALGAEKAELDRIFRVSDIISLHAPSIPATRHMINAETLALMKDDVVLINTARGSLIDEDALYARLKAGKLKYACLDVTDPEPPAENHPLRTLPNCIITPHLAGQANNGIGRIGFHVCAEIDRLIRHEPLTTQVTQAMLATMA